MLHFKSERQLQTRCYLLTQGCGTPPFCQKRIPKQREMFWTSIAFLRMVICKYVWQEVSSYYILEQDTVNKMTSQLVNNLREEE